MVTPWLQNAFIKSTGTLLMTPPSMCSSPSYTIGGNTPGERVVARTAFASDPCVWILSSDRFRLAEMQKNGTHRSSCLLYTSDAADERSSVDLGGRRIIKKKK